MDERMEEKMISDYSELKGSLQFGEALKPGEKPAGGPPAGFKPPMADISWVKRKYLDVAYAQESPNQRMDIYLPEEGEGPFPVLFHIHGGGFAIGDKRDDHMDTYLKFLKKGIAVGSIEYRLSREAIFPAAVLDCRQAIRFAREHAEEYCLDAAHIGVIGGSAGGNLSAILGMNVSNGEFPGEEDRELTGDCRVNVAVDQFGPISFKVMDEQARANKVSFVDHDEATSAESTYMGGALPKLEDSYVAKASPITYINPNMAPILVQHGLVDRLVPYAQSEMFVKEIRKKQPDAVVEFTTLPTADHEDKQYGTEENLNLIWEFISKYL